MELKQFKALWGLEGSYEEQFARIAAAGYAGVEAPAPSPEDADRFMRLLEQYRFGYVAQMFTGGDDHAASFDKGLAYAAGFRPLKIVSHSARDCMTDEEQDRFFASALEGEARVGIPVAHETHRHRAMFTPWTTARLLRKFPDLKIAADFSHWMTVCESQLEDQEANLAIAIERAIHIHGRIGYEEGPQVPHPAAPEYAYLLDSYLGWWRRIIARQASEGAAFATFTAEFGPVGYMHTLPFTNVPVADLWEVNQWMTDAFKAEFESWTSS